MNIQHDGNNRPFIECEQMQSGGPGTGGFKRAWIRRPTPGSPQDWAGTGRYINVAPIGGLGQGPAGQSADFPIFNRRISDDEALVTFVAAVCGFTGCAMP